MSWLLGLGLKTFTGNPVIMVYVALAIAAASASISGYAAWTLNGWKLGAKIERLDGERKQAVAQAGINAAAADTCSAAVAAHKKTSDAAMKNGEQLLAAAKVRAEHAEGQIAALDEYLRKPPPDGTCDKAWDIIERASGERS